MTGREHHLPLEGGGRPAQAGRVGVTALQQALSLPVGHRRHPTPPPPHPPPLAGEGRVGGDPPPPGEGEGAVPS